MFNKSTCTIMRQLLFVIFINLFIIGKITTAPRTRNRSNLPENIYLSKQNGSHNIQVHLKDFHIIALLSDESFGDYDYDYDYSDFTIKPNNATTTTTTTQKPENETTITTSSSVSTTASPNSTVESSEQSATTTEKPDNTQNSSDKIRVQIVQESESLPEVARYRKCAKGRCRRTRRPGIPINFSRIASNLMAKFQQNLAGSLPDLH